MMYATNNQGHTTCASNKYLIFDSCFFNHSNVYIQVEVNEIYMNKIII